MSSRPGDVLAELTLRPQVPMGAFHALGFVCALGAAEGLQAAGVSFAGIGWPQDVVDQRTYRPFCTIRMHAGYEAGMFATCTVVGAQQVALLDRLDGTALREALEAGIASCVARWEAQIAAGRGKAGPLAPILSEYYDLVALMGKPVSAVYPNGNEMARGTLVGIDIWGRVTLRCADGQELEFPPEKAGIRPA